MSLLAAVAAELNDRASAAQPLRPAAALRRSPRYRGRGPSRAGVDLVLPRAAGLGARPRRGRDAALRERGEGPRAHRRATLPRVDPAQPCAPAPHMQCWRAAFRGDGAPRERARDRAGARDGWAGGKDARARSGDRGDGRRPGTGQWRCGLSQRGDFWTVAYAGKAVRLRHGKGLGDIAILLANPGRDPTSRT